MKKKLLIVLMVVFFACLFSVFASAESYVPAFGKMTEVGGMSEKATFGKDGKFETCTSRVLMSDGVTYPSYYIYTDSAIHTVDFSELNQKTGKNYDRNTVICLEIPEGVTTILNCFNASGSQIFWGDKYTATIEYLKFSSTVTSMSSDATIYNIKSLKCVDMSLSKVQEIPKRGFRYASALEEVYFPTTLKIIGDTAFDGCSSLVEIDLSKTCLEDIGLRGFFECKALETIKFSPCLKKLQTQCFYKAGTSTENSVLNIYIPATFEEIYDAYGGTGIFQDAKTAVIYYTGTGNDTGISLIQSNSFKKGTSWATVDSKGEGFDENATYTANTIIYNYNVCKAFYDNEHDYQDTGLCIDGLDCKNCEKVIAGTTSHNEVKTLTYENGYTKNGLYSVKCTNEGCKLCVETDCDPIFMALENNGYSVNAYGTGIAFGGFVVNTEALKFYNDFNENDITFGIFVANPKYLGDTFMTNGEVNATSGFLKVDMTSDEYTNIKIMLDGFTGSAQNLELVISLYAYTDVNDVQFIQSEHTACANSKVVKADATLYTVTLNSVVNKINDGKIDALPEYGKKENE